jgi:hypothetical protein
MKFTTFHQHHQVAPQSPSVVANGNYQMINVTNQHQPILLPPRNQHHHHQPQQQIPFHLNESSNHYFTESISHAHSFSSPQASTFNPIQQNPYNPLTPMQIQQQQQHQQRPAFRQSYSHQMMQQPQIRNEISLGYNESG